MSEDHDRKACQGRIFPGVAVDLQGLVLPAGSAIAALVPVPQGPIAAGVETQCRSGMKKGRTGCVNQMYDREEAGIMIEGFDKLWKHPRT